MVLSIVLIAVFLIAATVVVADRFDAFGRLRRCWVREWDEMLQGRAAKKKKQWRTSFWETICGLFGAGSVGALWKYRQSADESWQKLLWVLVGVPLLALTVWGLLGVIDRTINRSNSALPDYSKITEEDALES